MEGLDVIALDGFDVAGDSHVVTTRHGPVTVTVQGDRRKPALVTFHDVGLNHRTCFQPLFVCAGPRSDLVNKFCAYHIDAPGCQDGAVEENSQTSDADGATPSLDSLAERCEDVVLHFNLTNVTVLGVGAGATVMALYASRLASRCAAAIFVSPSCGRASTMEHILGATCKFNMGRYGWTPWTTQHLLKRMFSYRSLGGSLGLYGSDLAQTAKREMSEMNAKAVLAYYNAALHRLDNSHIYSSLDIDCIILAGQYSPWYKDTILMNSLMRASKTTWIELEGCGTVATMEDPSALLSPIDLFIQRLKSEGLV
jgi:protein NDRG1